MLFYDICIYIYRLFPETPHHNHNHYIHMWSHVICIYLYIKYSIWTDIYVSSNTSSWIAAPLIPIILARRLGRDPQAGHRLEGWGFMVIPLIGLLQNLAFESFDTGNIGIQFATQVLNRSYSVQAPFEQCRPTHFLRNYQDSYTFLMPFRELWHGHDVGLAKGIPCMKIYFWVVSGQPVRR